MYAANDYLVRSEIKKTTWALTLSSSVIGHFLFFAMIFFFPGLGQTNKEIPTVIDIDIVSVTENEIQAPAYEEPVADTDMDVAEEDTSSEPLDQLAPETIQPPEKVYEQKQFQPLTPIEQPKTFIPLKPMPEIVQPKKISEPDPEPTREPEPVRRPEIKEIKPIERPPVPDTPKIKRSLKKQTIKKEQVARNKNKRHLTDTFRQLQQKVRIAEATKRIQQVGEKKSSVELMDIYKAEVMSRINKNWAVSVQMIGGYETHLSAILVINIMRNGVIQPDMWFEKKSGNDYFDECAIKAVKKSNPLPPLPGAYLRPVYGPVGLKFTPSGLK
jgi:colicin import membrane protein